MKNNNKIIVAILVLIFLVIGGLQLNNYKDKNNEENDKNKENEVVEETVMVVDMIKLISEDKNFTEIIESKVELEEVIDNISEEKYISVFQNKVSEIDKNLDNLIKLFENKLLDQGSNELLKLITSAKTYLNNSNESINVSKESDDKDELEKGIKGIMKAYIYIDKLEEVVESSSEIKSLQDEIDDIDKKDLSDIKISINKSDDDKEAEENKEKEENKKKEEVVVQKDDKDEKENEKEDEIESDKYYSNHKEHYKNVKDDLLEICNNSSLVQDYLYQENYNPDYSIYDNEIRNIISYCEYWGADLWRHRECDDDDERAKEEKFRLSMKKMREALDYYFEAEKEDGKDSIGVAWECAKRVIEQMKIIESITF